MQVLAAGQGIAYLEVARVRQTDYITCKRLIDRLFLLRHKAGRRTKPHLLPLTHVRIIGITLELTRADLEERYARAVVGIHVGVDLEAESRELLLHRIHLTLLGNNRARRGSDVHKALQEFLYTERIQRRAEEYRCKFACQVGILAERVIYTLDHLQILAELGSVIVAYKFGYLRVGNVLKLNGFGDVRLVGLIEVERLLEDVVHTLEPLPAVDRPTQRTHLDAEFGFDFVQQVERVFTLAIHLVDEHHDGRLSHPADLHQSARLHLYTLGGINDDDDRIHCRERAEGVFGKVLVTRGIEDVDMIGCASLW